MAAERVRPMKVTVYEPEPTPFPIPTRILRDPAGFYTLRDRYGVVWATLNPTAVPIARFEASVAQLVEHVTHGETTRVVAEYRARCREHGERGDQPQ